MQAPELLKTIPRQIINEGASLGPLDLKDYIQTVDGAEVQYQAELESGNALPAGIICLNNGVVSGIPAEGTQGDYVILINAKSAGGGISATFKLTIKPRISIEAKDAYARLKAEVWDALEKNIPIPETLLGLFERELSTADVYYLIQRFASFTIWNVYNLDSPSEKKLLTLEGSNEHFNIYDRGSCLVAAPKDLFSFERTLEDALQTARVMAREVFKRGWVIEFAGFDKMVRAAWVELQLLANLNNKPVEIFNFTASQDDVRIYDARLSSPALDPNAFLLK